MSYVLATTESRVRWYAVKLHRIEDIQNLKHGDFKLLGELNLEYMVGLR